MNRLSQRAALDATASDGRAELERAACDRLCGHVAEFQILLGDGGLILRGRARTYYAKQLAQETVMRFTDLPILANEIDVF